MMFYGDHAPPHFHMRYGSRRRLSQSGRSRCLMGSFRHVPWDW